MADIPDDAHPITRRSTVPLPPFVGPRSGAEGVRRTPERLGAQHGGRSGPARLYTPPPGRAMRVVPAPEPIVLPVEESAASAPSESREHEDTVVAPTAADQASELPSTISAEPDAPAVAEVVEDTEAVEDTEPAPPVPSAADAPMPWAYGDVPHPETESSAQHEEWAATEVAAEHADDDWFAEDESDSPAPAEPVHPTPAFNDLTGLERLVATAASDETTAAFDETWSATTHVEPVAEPAAVSDAMEEPAPMEPTVPLEPTLPPVLPTDASLPTDDPQTPVASVADAIERVAMRVREGGIVLPTDLPTSSEAAALAAVLAALLRAPSR